MTASAETIEEQIRIYAAEFLKANYGEDALKKLSALKIIAVDTYDCGGVSEATEQHIKIAARRDVMAGKLTDTTKLIVRHELGHTLDAEAPAFPEFDEEIQHEEIAWQKAKPRNAAERWYKNVSVRTHLDPVKMAALGFPRPEWKVPAEKLRRGMLREMLRMGRDSVFVNRFLAERFAMAHLVEDPDYYC